MDKSIQEPFSAEFQRNNDQDRENKSNNNDKQIQNEKNSFSPIKVNKNKIEKEQIKGVDFNSSILFDYTNIQSTGLLVLNDQQEILKYNNQFASLIQQLQSFTQESGDSTNLNSSDQINQIIKTFFVLSLNYNQITTQKLETKKHLESKYKENQRLSHTQNYKKDHANNQSQSSAFVQQEPGQSVQNEYKGKSQQHFSKLNLMHTSLDDDLLNIHNKLNQVQEKQKEQNHCKEQINFNKKDSSIKEENVDFLLENSNTQNKKPHLQQPQIINNKSNFFSKPSPVCSQADSTFNKELIQCQIPNDINKFFEQKQAAINVSNLLNFLIQSKPKEKSEINNQKIQKCKICHKIVDKFQEININQNKQSMNFQTQTYKYSIQQDFLTISLKFFDNKNKKRNFDIKIGCFKSQENEINQKNIDFICETCDKKSMNELQEVEEQSENQKESTYCNILQSRSFIEQKLEKSLKNPNKQAFINLDSIETNSNNNNNNNYVKQIKLIGLNFSSKGNEALMQESNTKQNIQNASNCDSSINDLSYQHFVKKSIQFLQNSEILLKLDNNNNNISNQILKFQNQECAYIFTIEILETNFEVTTRSLKQRMDKFKRKMLCSISHELRTPLNCIISMLDIMNMNNDISDLARTLYVNPALFSSYILLNIINDILDLAEINRSGQIKMMFQEFSPLNLCIECMNFIKLQASQKNLQLELICEESVPNIVYTDLDKTRQVLLNLLSNALKFTQKGSVVIKLSYPQDQIIQIDVKDTGCGIHASKLRQIFNNFTHPDLESINSAQKQNSPTLKKQQSSQFQKNAGLGLSISFMLASCLGDNRQLTVKSEVGKGSTFTFFVVNKSNQKKGCILYHPQNKFESQASLKTKLWIEKGELTEYPNLSALNQKKISDKQYTESQKQNIDEDQAAAVNKDYTNIQNLNSENQIQSQGTLKRNKKRLSNANQGSLQNIVRQQFKKPTIETQEYNDSNTIQELFPIDNIQRQDSLSIRKQASILYNNLSKTTLQIIQQASSLQSYIFSAKEINDEQSQQITSKGIYLNTNNTIVSSDQTPQVKYIIQNNTNISEQATNSNQNNEIKPIRFKESEIFSKQNQLNIFSPLLKVRQSKKQSNLSIQFNFDFNEESPHMQSTKTLNITGYDENLNAFIKNTQKKILIQQLESCNVLNDSFDIKSPQQFTPHVERFRQRQSSQQSYNKSTSNNLHVTSINSKLNEEPQHLANPNQNQQNLVTSLEKNSNQNLVKVPQENFFDQQNQVDFSNYCCSITNRSKQSTFQLEKIEEIIQNQQKQCQCTQILLVDDNEFNLYALEARLRMYQFSTDKTTSGFQALELIKKKYENSCCKRYHLIFMDIDMPEMNGYQATQEIIKLSQKLKISRPIISACSAYVQEDDKIKAFNSGMDFYITKPINISAFENVLNQVFCNIK
ncbi:response regulator receiver domain protein (macronuclear) [Tetrahymena thermophila SB210]|uniref:histidine kinase n=1 Tax=Tetrahymena thermophila (strain SB210) TaxID=312017 RepID=W7X1L9_TETTS|nr:response regulator receiver domain protein [Tetrahymena thermophila SB210]EWS71512.1 response regulator receiver domain protein [Tetrahymena thermophila SB210]|eukprot:XP_012655957.1 response regulator receiver domain protein [Tetrahymena thermophila SB210]